MKLEPKITKKFNFALEEAGILDLDKKLRQAFPKAEVFVVGGAVRDIILGRATKDMDILVRNVKMQDLQKFLSSLGRVNLVGKRFGVLKFVPQNHRAKDGEINEIDIALPRTDVAYGTGVYKDFKIKTDPRLKIEEDLSRRDFTVNAMAWHIFADDLVDPFHGIKDLQKKVIRAVGRPEARFKEDYSRMLRAARFAMQLDFKIETKTLVAMKKMIGRINDKTNGEYKVPREVLAAEFLKSFNAKPVETIKFYLTYGVAGKLMPELLAMKKCGQPKEFHSEGDVLTHTLMALSAIGSPAFKKYFSEPVSLTTKIAILLHDVGKPKSKTKIEGRTVFYNHDKIGRDIARDFLSRLKLSAPPIVGIDEEEILWLIENHLLFFYSAPETMKKTTLEKYLFNKRFSGLAHMQLFLADALACRPANGKVDLRRFRAAYKLWKSFSVNQKPELPKPLLNGDEVMKILNIKPGKEVGRILESLREEQLAGRIGDKQAAEKFVSSGREVSNR
jgi:poly(A) polymerase